MKPRMRVSRLRPEFVANCIPYHYLPAFIYTHYKSKFNAVHV